MLQLVAGRRPKPGDPEREVCVWRDVGGRVFARAFARGVERWIHWPGLGVFAFAEGADLVHVWPDASADWTSVADAFARVLQPIILQALGRQALHASGVLGQGGVLGFCGVGHSGKSTLAYALRDVGFRQAADDALVFEREGNEVRVRLLAFAPGLREPTRQYLVRTGLDERAEAGPAFQIGQTAPLRGILILRQDTAAPAPLPPVRVPSVQAFAALVTHARCFDEADAAHARQLVDDYLAVAEFVPVFVQQYPPHFEQLPALIHYVTTTARDLGVTPFEVRLAAAP